MDEITKFLELRDSIKKKIHKFVDDIGKPWLKQCDIFWHWADSESVTLTANDPDRTDDFSISFADLYAPNYEQTVKNYIEIERITKENLIAKRKADALAAEKRQYEFLKAKFEK